jgi:RNA polymerase sigma-70 factor (ECF subfamily)
MELNPALPSPFLGVILPQSGSLRIGSQARFAIEDKDIILEVLAGNQNAYAAIVRKYQARIRGYCVTALRDGALADDAAQEVFIKAYQSLNRFEGKSSLSTWLYRIAVNHCTDMIRKRVRQKTESWDALLEREGEKIEALFSEVTPEQSTNDEQKELITKLLAHLPEKSRQMLILREVEGLSYQELAQTLNCTQDAVKARLKRTRKELETIFRQARKSGCV